MPRRIGEQRFTTKDRIRAKPFRLLERADRANTDAADGPGTYDRWQTLHRLVRNWVYRGDPLADDLYTLMILIGRGRQPRTYPALPFDADNEPPIPITEQDIAAVRLPFADGEQALIQAIGRTWHPTNEPWLNLELKRWARAQKPRLKPLETKHQLIRLALEYFRQARPDQDPQFVQVGKEWIVDKRRKRRVVPDSSWRHEGRPLWIPAEEYLAQEPDDLNSGEYVEWFCRKIQHIVRDTILEVPPRRRKKQAALTCPICEQGQIVRGQCNRCGTGMSGVFGDEQITARPSALSHTKRKARGDGREQIDQQATWPDEELLDDAGRLDDDANRDAQLAEEKEQFTGTSRELRDLAYRARQAGISFRGLQANILALAETRQDLTNIEIALLVASSEGSVKDARRKIRKKLSKLNPLPHLPIACVPTVGNPASQLGRLVRKS